MKLELAMFGPSLPCNPRPFLNRLLELTEDDFDMKRPEIRSLLWILNMQSYGELATIDLYTEWLKLNKELNP